MLLKRRTGSPLKHITNPRKERVAFLAISTPDSICSSICRGKMNVSEQTDLYKRGLEQLKAELKRHQQADVRQIVLVDRESTITTNKFSELLPELMKIAQDLKKENYNITFFITPHPVKRHRVKTKKGNGWSVSPTRTWILTSSAGKTIFQTKQGVEKASEFEQIRGFNLFQIAKRSMIDGIIRQMLNKKMESKENSNKSREQLIQECIMELKGEDGIDDISRLQKPNVEIQGLGTFLISQCGDSTYLTKDVRERQTAERFLKEHDVFQNVRPNYIIVPLFHPDYVNMTTTRKGQTLKVSYLLGNFGKSTNMRGVPIICANIDSNGIYRVLRRGGKTLLEVLSEKLDFEFKDTKIPASFAVM